jgi:cobalt-zinc-cadmium efflux system outer membrane protein
LLGLLGFAETGLEFRVESKLLADPGAATELPPMSELMADAFAARPDLRAAELAIEIAGAKSGLARAQYMSISAVIDANERGLEGTEVGPGIDVALPLFDRAQADKARAAAELEQAVQRYAGLRNRIAAQVRDAHSRLSNARVVSAAWHEGIVRLRRESVSETRASEEAGEVSHLALLNVQRDYVDALLQQAEVDAEVLRAEADLEDAIGRALNRAPVHEARLQ